MTVPIVLGLFLVAAGGVYATYRYDASTQNRMLPGITIAGIDVGGMTRREAMAAVKQSVATSLDRQVNVKAAGQTWTITSGELGTKSDFRQVVDQALAVNEQFSWAERSYRRLLDRSVDRTYEISFTHNEERVRRFVETIAGAVNVSPTNAQVDFLDGQLVLERPEKGKELRLKFARESLLEALSTQDDGVRFAMRTLQPKITTKELGYTIVIRLSDLKLYLYKGLDLVKSYPVAAGQPAYPTPTGDWTIINKAENPTWINPAPDGWGADMPAVIEGGPANPLGTRALYLDAPGIRIHGTSDSASIGTFASHGCVRMNASDVEELYELVPIGTSVHVVP